MCVISYLVLYSYWIVLRFTLSMIRLKQNLFGFKYSFTVISGGRFFPKYQCWPLLCLSWTFLSTKCLSLTPLLSRLRGWFEQSNVCITQGLKSLFIWHTNLIIHVNQTNQKTNRSIFCNETLRVEMLTVNQLSLNCPLTMWSIILVRHPFSTGGLKPAECKDPGDPVA